MAIIAPSSSTIKPHGSQRNVGIESKNAHCTYQVLSASPLAFSAETRGEQPFLVFSQATQQLAPLQKEHSPRKTHTFCAALSPQGPQALPGALADLSGSETQRNPGLNDSVLLEREREEAKPQERWLCGSHRHHHPTSPRVTWQCPLAMGFSLSPFLLPFWLPLSLPLILSWELYPFWRRKNLPLLLPLQRTGRVKYH